MNVSLMFVFSGNFQFETGLLHPIFLILTDLKELERPMWVALYLQKPNISICHFII